MNKILIKVSVPKTIYLWKLTVCAFLYRQIMVERKGHHHWFWKGSKIGASHLSNQREGGTTELCYAAGKSQMAISDPYQSAKWLKVHLAKWRLASSIIHDALFSLLQGIHCSSQFYVYTVGLKSYSYLLHSGFKLWVVTYFLFMKIWKKNYLQNRELYLNWEKNVPLNTALIYPDLPK